jgi:SAM-dependent methyltransferase
MSEVYDTIGTSDSATRRADPRIERAIWSELNGCRLVLNIGAVTGAYEISGLTVVSVEPSVAMRAARPPDSAPCVRGVAESLPFDDASFDAALAILTVHHWGDYAAGLRELRRVARGRVVILHWDQDVLDPILAGVVRAGGVCLRPPTCSLTRAGHRRPRPRDRGCPADDPARLPGRVAVAYWRRPEAYLDPTRRASMSVFAQTEHLRGDGLQRLECDLDNGAWRAKHHALLNLSEHDCGYRLVIGSMDRPKEQ